MMPNAKSCTPEKNKIITTIEVHPCCISGFSNLSIININANIVAIKVMIKPDIEAILRGYIDEFVKTLIHKEKSLFKL